MLFCLLSALPIFEHKNKTEDKLLKITIPESPGYAGVFDDIFERYCTRTESVGVKTTAMGSMFRLSYRILCRKRH